MFIDRTASVSDELAALGLNPGHLIVITEVNPSRNLPYHNSHHCLSVGLNALEGARVAGLGIEAQRTLFLAGLYHDFNHGGGARADQENVEDAARNMLAWCTLLEDFAEEQLAAMEQAILATCWPSEQYSGPRTLIEDILCDADLLQWTEPDTEDFMAGFAKEAKDGTNWETTLVFLKKHWPRTEWAQQRVRKWLQEYEQR